MEDLSRQVGHPLLEVALVALEGGGVVPVDAPAAPVIASTITIRVRAPSAIATTAALTVLAGTATVDAAFPGTDPRRHRPRTLLGSSGSAGALRFAATMPFLALACSLGVVPRFATNAAVAASGPVVGVISGPDRPTDALAGSNHSASSDVVDLVGLDLDDVCLVEVVTVVAAIPVNRLAGIVLIGIAVIGIAVMGFVFVDVVVIHACLLGMRIVGS